MSEYNQTSGLKRVLAATGYSLKGLRAAYKYEAAFRQEVWLSFFLIPLGFFLGDGSIEKLLLVGSVMLVLIVELLNSAIEAVVDRVGPEHHKLSGRAKDQGSAAVLLSLTLVAIVWVMVLVA